MQDKLIEHDGPSQSLFKTNWACSITHIIDLLWDRSRVFGEYGNNRGIWGNIENHWYWQVSPLKGCSKSKCLQSSYHFITVTNQETCVANKFTETDLGAKLLFSHLSHRDIYITAHGTFLHIAITNTKITNNSLKLCSILSAHVWFRDHLKQWNSCSVQIYLDNIN